MVAKSLEVGDLVWAKMKGYPPWPGKIMVPPADAKPKKNHHLVYFFGSENYAWIIDENIQLHSDKLVEKYGNKKTGNLQSAIEIIIEKSKGVSKYNRSKGSSETPDVADALSAKESENNIDKSPNSEAKSKNKSLSSNSSSTPKKFKKKIIMRKSSCPLSSVKRLSSVKKHGRKRAHSPDHDDPDAFASSFGFPDLFNSRSSGSFSPRNLNFDDQYVNLMSNVPPNLSYADTNSTPVTGVLQRTYYDRPDTPPCDLSYQSESFKKKKVEATNKKIGFLGLGKIGQGIVKNLCHSGHSIVVWNQTPYECEEFKAKFNVQIADTPADVIEHADITFSYVCDADQAKQIVFGNCGILKQLEQCNGERKGYVEMTCMDPKCSEAIGHEIRMKGGRYLEAPLSGSRIDANEGTLLILAAGDKSLYDNCKSCFDAISKKHTFLGDDVGVASKMSLVHNMLVGTLFASVAEALALIQRIGIKGEDFLDVVKDGVINSQTIVSKGLAMIKNEYVSNTSLKQMQQQLNLGLSMGDQLGQPTPIFAATNETYKHCKSMRYGDHDVSAVFEGTKP